MKMREMFTMNTTQPTNSKTKFEQDLELYFPDMYRFWSLFKFDPFYEEVMSGILEMVDRNAYGIIEIVYQNGKINFVNQKRQLTANKSHKIDKINR